MYPTTKMLSEKGHILIVVNNYKYRQYRIVKRSGETCWCCTKKNCRAKVYTIGSDLLISNQKGKHDHMPLPLGFINRQLANNPISIKTGRYATDDDTIIESQDFPDVDMEDKQLLQTNNDNGTTINGYESNWNIGTNLLSCNSDTSTNNAFLKTENLSEENSTSYSTLEESAIKSEDSIEFVDVKIFSAANMNNFNIGEYKVGFLGGGNMATAIVTGLLKTKTVNPNQIWISSLTNETKERWNKNFNVNIANDNGHLFSTCDIIIIAVKPQTYEQALSTVLQTFEIPESCKKLKFIVSVMAGVTIADIKKKCKMFLQFFRIIRTLPNTPLMVGEGITVYSSDESPPTFENVSYIEDKIMELIFSSMGIIEKVPEKLINPISALSGSGPAYVYLMMEALADGAVKMGVPRAMANKYAAQVMIGSGKMVLQSGKHFALLKDEVCSPNGTTITGIHALERGGVRGHLMNAIEAATKRADELGQSSK